MMRPDVGVKPRIVLLGAHRWRREAVVQTVCDLGFEPILIVYEKEIVSDALLRTLKPHQLIHQSLSSPRSAKQIADLLFRMGGDWFALGLDDYVCNFAAELSTFTSAPTMRPDAAIETREKHLLRARWNMLCRDNPRLFAVPFQFLRFSDLRFETIVERTEDLTFCESGHLIVKPDGLDASIGIHKVKSWHQLSGAIESIRRELAPLADEVRTMGIDISPTIVVEHQIPRSQRLHPGGEFSVEVLSTRVSDGTAVQHSLMGITEKYIDPKTCVEIAHCFPSAAFPHMLLDTVWETTSQMLDELGVQFCISHWEYIVTDEDRLALVEAQLRPAGDWIMQLITRATGHDPYGALLGAVNRERKPSLPDFAEKQIAAVFFPLPEREILGRFSIVCEAEAEPLLGKSVFIDPDVNNASSWARHPQWCARYLSVITEGQSFDEAKELCQRVVSKMKIHQAAGSEQTRFVLPL